MSKLKIKPSWAGWPKRHHNKFNFNTGRVVWGRYFNILIGPVFVIVDWYDA